MTQNIISFNRLLEEKRHNVETERLTGEKQAEDARHNKAVEEEAQRSNKMQEQLTQQQQAINKYQAEIEHYRATTADYQAQQQAAINAINAQENIRHNQANESLTAQQNAIRQQEAEIARQKLEYERINAQANAINANTRAAELEEQSRHNMATEAETNRHNMVMESQGQFSQVVIDYPQVGPKVEQIKSQTKLNYGKLDESVANVKKIKAETSGQYIKNVTTILDTGLKSATQVIRLGATLFAK